MPIKYERFWFSIDPERKILVVERGSKQLPSYDFYEKSEDVLGNVFYKYSHFVKSLEGIELTEPMRKENENKS